MSNKEKRKSVTITVRPNKRAVVITIKPSGKIVIEERNPSSPGCKKYAKKADCSYSSDNPVIEFLRSQKHAVSFGDIIKHVDTYKVYVWRVLRWGMQNGCVEKVRNGYYRAKKKK